MAATIPPGDPIVACATAWGPAAIAIVRLSGAGLPAILASVCGATPAPRRASLRVYRDHDGVIDEGLVTWFPGPGSYTGEDLAELSCHGNALVVERLLAACCAAGARMAMPGEFTRRAFLQGRLDLPRAEAVLQLLSATSAAGVRVARAGLDGAVSMEAAKVRFELVDVAAELEAMLDYPGEDLLFSGDEQLALRLGEVSRGARAAAASFNAGRFAVEGARVALVGKVNAGKSTLFNALLGRARALVSAMPGTTRDVVEASLQLPTMRVVLLDTAGLRDTTDSVEAEGVALGQDMAGEADLRVLVVPVDEEVDRAAWNMLVAPRLLVRSFADRGAVPDLEGLPVCALTGDGIDRLKEALPAALRAEAPGDAALVLASQRQRDDFVAVAAAVDRAVAAFPAGPAVVVEELYVALRSLDALVGRDTRETVLDRLFERFCVGK